jgi:RNA polymerase sporulation-specific sigma factor
MGVNTLETADEELAVLAQTDNTRAMEHLLNKYRSLVQIKARRYFLIGADREDLIQEGMIGLYKAVRDFKPEKLVSFRSFAELCITRQIITAVKSATRQKHIALNQYISLDKPFNDTNGDQTLLEIIASPTESDPEQFVLAQEMSDHIRCAVRQNLSEFEAQVLEAYLKGKTYQETALEVGRPLKAIDNAAQRVKKKVERNLAQVEFR